MKKDQFIYELAQYKQDTGTTTEARMDIIAETLELRAMLDVQHEVIRYCGAHIRHSR